MTATGRVTQFLADLRADEFTALDRGIVAGRVQGLEHVAGDLVVGDLALLLGGGFVLCLGNDADGEIVGASIGLHHGILESAGGQCRTHIGDIDGALVTDFDVGAAGEVEAEVETANEDDGGRQDHEDGGHAKRNLAPAHEVDIAVRIKVP